MGATMVNMNEQPEQMNVQVAPAQSEEGRSRDSSEDSTKDSGSTMLTVGPTRSSSYQAQITPPATPNGSQEALPQQLDLPLPVFHNFLRSVYPFQPTDTVSDSTVTLPLNEGDIVLVHSIHTNGWADGTLLLSGARGWLPTNYCEAYEPDYMRNLLKALLNFWDLMRSGLPTDADVFSNQEFMRGIIAGVRYLLERSHCLTRDSPRIQNNDGLRRYRKALLSDLSSLVKTAKLLQENRMNPSKESDDENDLIDEMVLKAFKIVTRGVRFLDVLEDDIRMRHHIAGRMMATVTEEGHNPPTPPADSLSFQPADPASDTGSRRTSNRSSTSGISSSQGSDEQSRRRSYSRVTNGHSESVKTQRPRSVQIKRLSVSHRLSIAGPIQASENRVSERLSACHDTLLSVLGSLIGRLHLQSQSPSDLLVTIRQSIAAGRSLLAIIEIVWSHGDQTEESLTQARDTMYACVNELMAAAQDCVRPSGSDFEEVMLPDECLRLKSSATDCVVAAGECVAKTKFVIEKIGDFELDPQEDGLGIDLAAVTIDPQDTTESSASTGINPTEPASNTSPIRTPTKEKPLPNVPIAGSTAQNEPSPPEPIVDEQAPSESSRLSRMSLLPPIPKINSPLMSDEYNSSQRSSAHDGEFHSSVRSESIAASTSASSSTYLSNIRDSESSMLSQTSTRATTPDVSAHPPSHQSSMSNLSESRTALAEDMDYAETKMLEKTFAHELLYSKEGQITGGTLPALIERLTTHDATPDAMFVSTFYLTFRLFVEPVHFAQALIDRFDYVAQSPHVAGPVRLRVYNVFKGWLESHWRESCDSDALPVIESFAQNKLCPVIPAAGRRLLELARKVSSTQGSIVPRLVSSMGKTNTSILQYIPPDTPLPTPILSKSQVNALKNWKMGGTMPTILDFDPLELARQFTIKEMNIFCSIMPEELLASEWMKKTKSTAVNVRAMSTLSTDLSNLVADTILQHEDAKKRATIIKHWIKIANKCLELNNYDSLMAIICSLNSSTIHRMKRTWDMVPQKRQDILRALQDIVEPTKNYAVLRQRLYDHVPPCLPFVGTYLTDLTFVDIGNPATKQLPGIGGEAGIPVINFDKHARTAKIIGELQRFQIPYRLTEVPELQEWIQAHIVRVRSTNDLNNVQQFYRKSLLLEPRSATSQRASPVESQHIFGTNSSTKSKVDIFAWTHSKEKTSNIPPALHPISL